MSLHTGSKVRIKYGEMTGRIVQTIGRFTTSPLYVVRVDESDKWSEILINYWKEELIEIDSVTHTSLEDK
jgi:hypothetical protein